MNIAPVAYTQLPSPSLEASRENQFREVANAFEAAFLSEMLKAAGLGKSRDAFGGGAGEEAFSSMMVEKQAKLMADQGGIGLSEHIFQSLWQKEFPND